MNTASTEKSVRPEVIDPNRVSPVYQVLYLGPSDYDGTVSEKHELTRVVRSFQTLQVNNSQIVKIRASYLLGMFLVWTKTREAAETLFWSVEGYERRYEVAELHYNQQRNEYLRSQDNG